MQSSVFRVRVAASLACALLAAAGAVAQDKPTNAPVRMPEVVVTATRSPEPVEKTAASVTVIRREDFEARKFSTLAEVLDAVPGLTVVRAGTPGQQTALFTRGTESNHTLLTVDGRRLPSQLDGTYDWGSLTLDNVERIEVVRSANSALYGANAIGGVVNIITRTGRGLKQPEHEVSFEGGSFNTFREAVASRGAAGKVDYAVGASQLNAEFPRDNNDYRLTTFKGSFGYEATRELYFDVKASYYQAEGGSPGNLNFGGSLTDHFKREVAHVSPGMTWNPTEQFETKLLYTFENQFQPSSTFGSTDRLTVASHVMDWQNTLQARENWKLTAGVLFQEQNVDRTTTSFGVSGIKANTSTLGGYAQSQWNPWAALTVINAFRYDAFSDYKSAFTWRQGVACTIPVWNTVLFGNISRSVAAPSPQDLYFESDFAPDPSSGYLGDKSAGNPNLRPERAQTFEVGVKQPLANQTVEISATYFRTELQDAITFVSRPYPTASTAENINRALTEGVEGGLRYQPTAALTLRTTYTYLTARDETTGLRLLRRPRHQIAAEVVYQPIEKLTLSSSLTGVANRQDVGNVRIEDYFTLRATAAYKICKNAQVWLRGENLTDVQYQVISGYPALRLGVYGGLKLSF